LGLFGNLGNAKIAVFSNVLGAECAFPVIGPVVAISKLPIFTDEKSFTALPGGATLLEICRSCRTIQMLARGRVQNGVVIIHNNLRLPNGTPVVVSPETPISTQSKI
jgi:hypothetical protein